jgi:hypothetical protein
VLRSAQRREIDIDANQLVEAHAQSEGVA